ncbi:MAG: hypothetical protein CMJ34_12320 [Phycisphaerae bacterium]|nr:hypothetical protein [Phycisphaerae bacterium]
MTLEPLRPVSLLTIGLAVLSAQAGDDIVFEVLPGGLAHGVSADGTFVVGENGSGAYLWSLEGTTSLGQLAGIAVSADGRFVVGDTSSPVGESAGRWNPDGGWSSFGGLGPSGCGSSLSSAYDISADGQRCVGLGWNGCSAGAFLWTPGEGMFQLPQSGPNSSRADTISGDGMVIGGWDEASNGSRRASVWTQNPKNGDWTQDLLLAGTPGNVLGAGEVNGSNGDGSVVVGSANGSTDATSGAFLRHEEGLEILGFLPPISSPYTAGALDVTEDGRTVVGFQREGLGGGQSFRATLWTPETGLIPLKDHLISLGADIPANFTLAAAMSMSDDGRVICGWGYEDVFFFQDSWIVVLPGGDEPPCPGDFNGDGTVSGADLGLMLVAWGTDDPSTDLDGDGDTDGADLGLMLSAFGSCP